MHSSLYLALSALATLAAADYPNAFNIPKGGYQFEVGEPTTLNWTPTTDGTVSLKLQSGEVLTPDSGTDIASHIDNSGSFTWTPSEDIENNSDYTIEIIDNSDSSESNYLPRFSVSGATATASASSTSTASSTASSSASISSESSTTASASTMTTMTNTTSSPSTTGASTTTTTTTGASSTASTTSSTSSAESSSSTPSASSSAAASSSSSAGDAEATASDTGAGMVNRVSGGMMAIVLGVIAFM